MSRTEGILLPRLSTTHARANTSHTIQHHIAVQSRNSRSQHHKTLSEPYYTAYLGTPRQDVPHHVYHDAAMFDDVFERQGNLFIGRNTPKITSPLTSLGYNSLHDPHCQRLYLNNHALKQHLIHLGLLTDDLRVVASSKEQRQKIRAHEMLERKEQLMDKMEKRESRRIGKIESQTSCRLPKRYQSTIDEEEKRKKTWADIHQIKLQKLAKKEQRRIEQEQHKKVERKKQLQQLVEQINLTKQIKQNAAEYKEQLMEKAAYEQRYGKTADWHRESDAIHNRMVILSQTKWAKKKRQQEAPKIKSPPLIPTPQSGTGALSSSHSIPVSHPLSDKNSDTRPSFRETESHKTIEETTEMTEVEEIAISNVQQSQDEDLSGELKNLTIQENDAGQGEEEVKSTHSSANLSWANDNEVSEPPLPIMPKVPSPEKVEEPVASPLSPDKQVSVEFDQDTSAVELARLFTDILVQSDMNQSGFITFDQFLHIIGSRDLALPLDQEELMFIAGQANVYKNSWIPIIQVGQMISGLLVELFKHRIELQKEQYGAMVEDRWLQLQSPNMGYLYMEKTTGLATRNRPNDYRPYLREEPFEDVIVDLYETADSNRDGYVDLNEFLAFLRSPVISSRVYTHQMKELYQYFNDQAVEGYMTLEQFVPLGRITVQMIYSNSYPNTEWVELNSRKYGNYQYNPMTGDIKLDESQTLLQGSGRIVGSKKERKLSRASRRKKRQSQDNQTALTPSKPPPLRKRSADSNLAIDDSSHKEEKPIQKDAEQQPDTTKQLVEEVAQRLQSGLNIIDTIIEEEEPDTPQAMQQHTPDAIDAALDDAIAARH